MNAENTEKATATFVASLNPRVFVTTVVTLSSERGAGKTTFA